MIINLFNTRLYTMRSTVLLGTLLLLCCAGTAQQVFFKSAQEFDKDQLRPFYSSITIRDSLLLFNANDYTLYAYDKNSGKLQWNQYLSWKSNQAPFFVANSIWAQKGENKTISLDPLTGTQKELPGLYTVETQPLVKGNMVYTTGIYEGGCMLAYDLQADSVSWCRFLAHGCSVAPYYLADRIVANAEGSSWLEIGYDGKLIHPGCDSAAFRFPAELPCIKRFAFLSHDKKEISEGFIENEFGVYPETLGFYTTSKHTLLAGNDRLLVLGDRLKQKADVQLSSLADSLALLSDEPVKILYADETDAWLFVLDQLIIYDYQQKKLARIIDLSSWHPHQVLRDGERLWLISRTDGLLYGLTL